MSSRSRSLFNVLENTTHLQEEARELCDSREDVLHWQNTNNIHALTESSWEQTVLQS